MQTTVSDRAPAACAEFPNDNPALHGGAIWRCLEVLGAPSYEPPVTFELAPETCEVKAGFDDPFARLVEVLYDAARALGADDDNAACLRALFGLARADAISLAEPATQALVAGQVLVRDAGGLARTSAFTSQVLAWQGILRGESEDFGPLGPLDEWTADVVARVVGNPARADGIRRELRRRGVAAFGIVADAA